MARRDDILAQIAEIERQGRVSRNRSQAENRINQLGLREELASLDAGAQQPSPRTPTTSPPAPTNPGERDRQRRSDPGAERGEVADLELTAENADLVARSFGVDSKIDFLKRIRSGLDEGTFSVREFLNLGKPLATRINEDLHTLVAQGQGAKSFELFNRFSGVTGFDQVSGDERNIEVTLPDEFQKRLREELIDPNLPEEERRRLLEDIPTDIGFDEDRFQIEKEAVRQRRQGEALLGEAEDIRRGRLGELRNLLAGEEERIFSLDTPGIQEDLQRQGLLRSSGLGEALGRRRLELSGARETVLGSQALSDRDADIQMRQALLAGQLGFQTAGLEREFTTADFRREANLARQLGALAAPQTREASDLEKFGTFMSPLISAGVGAGVGRSLGGKNSPAPVKK